MHGVQGLTGKTGMQAFTMPKLVEDTTAFRFLYCLAITSFAA